MLSVAASSGGQDTLTLSAGQAGRVPVARAAAQDLAPAALQPTIDSLSARLAQDGIELTLMPECDADLDPLTCLGRKDPQARLLAVFGASSSTDRGIITLLCPASDQLRRIPFSLPLHDGEQGVGRTTESPEPSGATSSSEPAQGDGQLAAAWASVLEAARACGVASARLVLTGTLIPGLELDLDGGRLLSLDEDEAPSRIQIHGLREGGHSLTAIWPDGSSRSVEFESQLEAVQTLRLEPPHRPAWGTAVTLLASAGAVAAGMVLLVDEANDTLDFGRLPGTNPEPTRLDADDTDFRPLGVGLLAAGGTAATTELVLPRRIPWWVSPAAGFVAGGIAAGLTAVAVGS